MGGRSFRVLPLPSNKREDPTAYGWLGKRSKFRFKLWFLLNAYCFYTMVKLKNYLSQTIVSWRPSALSFLGVSLSLKTTVFFSIGTERLQQSESHRYNFSLEGKLGK